MHLNSYVVTFKGQCTCCFGASPFVSEPLLQQDVYFTCSVQLSPRAFSEPDYSRPSISPGSYLQTQPAAGGKDLKTKVTLALTGAV